MSSIKKSLPFHIQVYENLKERILQGELSGGMKILESKLSADLNVSRSPIREAIRMLQNDELIIETSSGLVINPMRFEDTVEVYECRMLLEPFAAKLTAKKISEEGIAELKSCIDKAVRFHREDQEKHYREIIECNSRFHQIINESCGHSRLKFYIKKNNALATLSRANEFFQFRRDADYIDEHLGIMEAIGGRDSDGAETRMKEHITHDLDFYKRSYRKRKEASSAPRP